MKTKKKLYWGQVDGGLQIKDIVITFPAKKVERQVEEALQKTFDKYLKGKKRTLGHLQGVKVTKEVREKFTKLFLQEMKEFCQHFYDNYFFNEWLTGKEVIGEQEIWNMIDRIYPELCLGLEHVMEMCYKKNKVIKFPKNYQRGE